MDSLSRLIALHAVRSSFDTRCSFGASWRIARDQRPQGVAPYHLVIAGRAQLEVEGRRRQVLEPGELVLLPRGAAHALFDPSGTAAVPYTMTAGPAQVRIVRNGDGDGDGGGEQRLEMVCGELVYDVSADSGLMRALPEVMVVNAGGPQRDDFRDLIGLIQREIDAAAPGIDAVLEHLASALFAVVLRAWCRRGDGAAGYLALVGDARLGPVFAAMLEDLGHAWTLEALAQRSHMSRATFVRAFRARAGAAPLDVLTRLRMAQACRWLAQSTLSLAEIGARIGYESEAAFSRAFKRTIGNSPGQFRQRGTQGAIGSRSSIE